VILELSSSCLGFSCPFCPKTTEKKKRENGFMPFEVVTALIPFVKPGEHTYIAGYGCSFLNPQFEKIVKFIKQCGIGTMLPTNVAELEYLSDFSTLRFVDGLHLSVDSLVDKKWKGQDVEKVLSTIDHIKQIGHSGLMVNMVIREENLFEIPDFITAFILNRGIPLRLTFESPCYTMTENMKKRYTKLVREYNNLTSWLSAYRNLQVAVDTGCSKFDTCSFRKNRELVFDWQGNQYPCTNAFFSPYKFDAESLQQVYDGTHPVCDTCKKVDDIWREIGIKRLG